MKSKFTIFLCCLHLTRLTVSQEHEKSDSISADNLNTDNVRKDDPMFSMPFGSHDSPISSKAFDDSVYYRINWLSNELQVEPNLPTADETSKSEAKEEKKSNVKSLVQEEDSLWITTANNEKYHCHLPQMISQPQKEQSTSNNFEKMNPFQLLKPLISKEVCSYRLESYWTYELCHGRYIRQFHEESTVQKISSQEYYLGKYDITQLSAHEAEFEAKLAELKKEGKSRPTIQVDGAQLPYVEINMTGGTLCDLNSKPRVTRVFYVCNEDSKHELYSIKEIFTCEYEAIVLSPLLCLHSDFRVATAPELDINCYAIGKSPAKPKGIVQFEAENKENRFESIFDKKSIVIGASEFSKEFKIDLKITEDGIEVKPVTENAPKQLNFDPKILRSFINGDLCLHGGTGWWKYEFCYGRKVEQYHEERVGQRTAINLGKWNKEEHIKWLQKNDSKKPKVGKTPKQVSHFYGGGDSCDLTGKPRQVEVKLKCRYTDGQPESVALYLIEPKPCEYVLGIESPIICQLLSTADEHGLLSLPEEEKSL